MERRAEPGRIHWPPNTSGAFRSARSAHGIALPLFIEPVELDGYHWCDGGIVDIFPVHPLLDIEQPCDVTLAINGFYPPDFQGEDARGWEYRRASILYVASQVRTCQQIELARENLARLRAASKVLMIEPVSYQKVQGVGFYRQFLSTREWPGFDASRAYRGTSRVSGDSQPMTCPRR